MTIYTTNTPIGNLQLESFGNGLVSVKVVPFFQVNQLKPMEMAFFSEPLRQLQQYFSGKRKSFQLKLALSSTPFASKVYAALMDIPFGETRSYKEIAQTIGHPLAYRAIGNANRKNPLLVIIPCHRVVAHSGKLGGYFPGLQSKIILLNHENQHS